MGGLIGCSGRVFYLRGGGEKMSLRNSVLIARLWVLCEAAEHTNCGSVVRQEVGHFVQASKG